MDWRSIRNLGKVRYFALSYVVLIGVPILAEITLALRRIGFPSGDRFVFPTTLKLLFLASVFYAVAVALYQFLCPSEIKEYESEDAFVDALQPLYERAHPDRKLEIVLAQLTDSQTQVRRSLEAHRDAGAREREKLEALVNTLYPSAVQRYLIGTYRRQLKARRPAIYLAAGCYILGTGVMIYLLVHRAAAVLEA